MTNLLRALGLAIAFLTRLPVPPLVPHTGELGRSLALYPLVGLGLGAALWALGVPLAPRLDATLLAAVLVAALALITGGLHLDGWADCFDALGVMGDRERRLAVMKDPRIGALGAVALLLALLLKILALAAALDRGLPWLLLPALALSRWLAVVLVVGGTPARTHGLGHALALEARWSAVAGGGVLVLVACLWAGPLALWGALGALALVVPLVAALQRHLGGLTGDVYGAAIEGAEIGFLLAVAVACGPLA